MTGLTASAGHPRVSMGEAVRLRLEGWMRIEVDKHADQLRKAVRHRVSIGGAIRDLITQALRGTTMGSAYTSGYVQGFLSGYSDGKQAGQIRSPSASGAPAAEEGPIRPHPSRDNEDYRGGGEGAP
jgi:hypothetical protein